MKLLIIDPQPDFTQADKKDIKGITEFLLRNAHRVKPLPLSRYPLPTECAPAGEI